MNFAISAWLAQADALTFHASFDETADADFALGDPKVHTGSGTHVTDPKLGIVGRDDISIAKGEGRYGGALRFGKKARPVIFFRGEKNVAYEAKSFSGTVSFWMRLDPERDLEPGYCDPLQVTDKKWDDACLFVDFSKDEVPRLFRLGVFSDAKEWNALGRKWGAIPDADRPFVVVRRHPFRRDAWTHVAFTFDGFNTGKEHSVARLYLNGESQGEFKGRRTFSWDPSKSAILLGINYIGLMDDLSIYRRALTADEIRAVGKLDGGVKALRK